MLALLISEYFASPRSRLALSTKRDSVVFAREKVRLSRTQVSVPCWGLSQQQYNIATLIEAKLCTVTMDNGRDVRKRTRRDQESNTTVPTGRKKRNKRPFAAAEDDAHEDQEDEAKTLRVVARSERFFWRPTIQDQLSHVVIDRAERCVKRAVPENEVLACALNEVAVAAGRGFFLYLPSRNVWKIAANETLLPAGRVPPQPG